MHAGEVLQRWMGKCWAGLDKRLVKRLVGAVDALVASRKLVLMTLARSFAGAWQVSAALKGLDRLLSNERVQKVREALYAELWRPLWPKARTVVVIVDWSVLKRDESLHLLRAAVPVGGRALTLWEEVHPQALLGSAQVHDAFLARLRRLLPTEVQPILVTDAGFGIPWFRSAEAHGFGCIGRLRGKVQLRPVGEDEWAGIREFDAMPVGTAHEEVCEVAKTHKWRARVVVWKNPPKGRKHRTVKHRTRRSTASRANARGALQPWVLIVSTALAHLRLGRIVAHYASRMQIEESFRDLKDPRFGTGLSHSLTRTAARMQVLLLIHACASMVAWLRARAACRIREIGRLLPHAQARKRIIPVLSLWRLGWELLKRAWPPTIPPDPLRPFQRLALPPFAKIV